MLSWLSRGGCSFRLTHDLQRFLIQLRVSLDHQLLERGKVFDRGNLVHNLFMQWVRARFIARRQKLLLRHSQLRHQLSEQLLDYLAKFLTR